MTLTAMEPPISFEADAVRDEQAKILHAIQIMTPEEVLTRAVRGQYGSGTEEGNNVAGYREEPLVNPQSSTETFVALKFMIDNWRWADVPFYIRTGKRLPKRVTEVAIQFRRAPFVLFRDTPTERLTPNLLVLHIQPDEGISLRFGAKIPGPMVRVGSVNMDFAYVDYFGSEPSTGYERLLYDCMIGDATLFQRAGHGGSRLECRCSDSRCLAGAAGADVPELCAGTWGPKEADDLLKRDGRSWRTID